MEHRIKKCTTSNQFINKKKVSDENGFKTENEKSPFLGNNSTNFENIEISGLRRIFRSFLLVGFKNLKSQVRHAKINSK